MADVHTGEAVVDNQGGEFASDSMRRVLLQSIYKKHGVTSADVDTSLVWYGHNIDKYMEVYEETEKILAERIAAAEREGVHNTEMNLSMARTPETFDGDSVNIWKGIRMRRNTAFIPSDYIKFNFSSDRNWEPGDRYALTVRGLYTTSPIDVVMIVDYNDGTSEYRSRSLPAGTRAERLLLVLDSTKTATNIYGNIHYKAQRGEVSYLDSISLIRTRGRNMNIQERIGQKVLTRR